MHKDIKNWRELSDDDFRALFLAFIQMGVDMDKTPIRCAECFVSEFDAFFGPLTTEQGLQECLEVLEEYQNADKEQMS